ncbi:TetR/AcrR family transcriptional regulator [Gephyromycinifex aptenodytis]|uniref:TetR/AcrR family transcriptional regulator n=1 Tax=Gephyromycinifex aptenodytis TaxID=2716227 RepID=UPI001447662D|nr:TetR/AcrR family transcriptional regulator [Gephyromycinifex aptenodytis]
MTATHARRGRPGHDQRAVLIAAVEAFDEHGYDATTMGMIAQRLSLSKSALYHHVEGKEQLLAIALETAFTALDECLRTTEESAENLDVRFEVFIREMVAVLLEYQPFVRLMLRLRDNSPVEQQALARRRDFDTRMAALVRDAQVAGLLRDDLDAAVVARLIFGAMNSTVEWFRPQGRLSPEELTEAVLTVVCRGVLTTAYPPEKNTAGLDS